jgi:hypothetical protein
MINNSEIGPAMIPVIRTPLSDALHVDFQRPDDGGELPAPFEAAIDDSEE